MDPLERNARSLDSPAPGAVEDRDLERLEAFLDRALSPEESGELERRLLGEPTLAAALGRMSAEYAMRRAVYRGFEPDEQTADDVCRSWAAPRIRGPARPVRIAGAIAACVALFAAGWIGHGYRPVHATAPAPATPAPVVYQVALTDGNGHITAVQKFDKLDEARAFAADVGRWQAEQQTRPPAPGVTSSGL